MGKLDKPGYPLPSGDLGEDEIICQLVFLPDRDEYWQAFLGAYAYLATWRAWERDDDKRGKDAASNWREAFELTIGCWRMACLEQLQQDVADILLELQNTVNCCENSDPTDGDQYTDPVTDGVGDVPQPIIDAGYADDAADWDGFDDYKCMVAHLVVDSMEAKLRKLAPHVDEAAKVVGGFATVAIIVSAVWTGGLSLLVGGLIASTGAVALLYAALVSGTALVTLADKIQTNHDSLACAFYWGDGSQNSVDLLKAKIDLLFTTPEEIILKNTGLEIDAKALYAGRHNEIDTAAALEDLGYDVDDFDCSCTQQIGEHLIEFGFDGGDWSFWQHPSGWVANSTYGRSGGWGIADVHPSDKFWQTTNTIRNEVGKGTSGGERVWINRVSFWYYMNQPTSGDIKLTCKHDGGTFTQVFPNALVWTLATVTFGTPLLSTAILTDTVRIEEVGMTGNATFVDDIAIDFDTDA